MTPPVPRDQAPIWFQVACAAIVALLLRACAVPEGAQLEVPDQAPPALAFWAIVATVIGAIWKGLEVAGRVTLEILKWSVLQLWTFARSTAGALLEVGKATVRGARRAWDFFEATYDKVIKPAWSKLWQIYEQVKKQLDKYVGPVLRFLQSVRTELLKYYEKWVRPILDSIGIAQKVLRVFRAFGWDWAVKLDGHLSELQRRIDKPLREVIGYLNLVINQVNRIATLDGMLQRFALIRSIERDIREVSRAFTNCRSVPVTDEQYTDLRTRAGRTEAEIWAEFVATVEPGGAQRDPRAREIAANWELALRR